MIQRLAVLFVLCALSPAWAQEANPKTDDDLRWDPAETRQERRERIREAREERRERIEEAREERRERMERWRDSFDNDGVHLRILRSYTLAEGETSNEPIVVIGGSARIDGRADDDVVVIGGGLHLGPKGVVAGKAVSIGGAVTLEPGASVQGSIEETVVPWPSIAFHPEWIGDGWWTGLAFGGSVLRLSFTLGIAVLLTLVAPGWIANISSRSAGASILTGLAAEVLFVPALIVLIVMLTVSIIGIPLLLGIPFLLAAFAFVWVAGFTGVAVRLGRLLRGRGGWPGPPAVSDLLIGYVIIIAVTVIAQTTALALGWLSPVTWPMRSAGLLVEYVAWTIGLGAAIASLFGARRVMPPPVPI